MADHIHNPGIEQENGRQSPYWVDPFQTQERTDPAIAPMLAAVAAVPAVDVQAMVDHLLAARRAALGW